MSDSIWPGWVTGELGTLLEDAEEEARERGHQTVTPEHLALAMVRKPAPIWELLRSLDVEPRRWRDYINHIMGVNEGAISEHDRRVWRFSRGPDELRYRGGLSVAPDSTAILEQARKLGGDAVAPEHLLVAFFSGYGGVASGTARWMGLTENRLLAALGLDPVSVRYHRGPGRRPTEGGALLLMGSCHPNPAAFDRAVALGGSQSGHPPRVIAVYAALGEIDRVLPDGFGSHGAVVRDSEIYTREQAQQARAEDVFKEADVIFLYGGYAKRLCDVLVGTPALDGIVTASDRGALIVGCSAGMNVLGAGCTEDWAAPGDPAGPFPLLDWLDGVVLEPHCSGPDSVERLRRALRAFPGTRGLGVAHQGVVLVHPGWKQVETITEGFDAGNFVLDGPDGEMHRIPRASMVLP